MRSRLIKGSLSLLRSRDREGAVLFRDLQFHVEGEARDQIVERFLRAGRLLLDTIVVDRAERVPAGN